MGRRLLMRIERRAREEDKIKREGVEVEVGMDCRGVEKGEWIIRRANGWMSTERGSWQGEGSYRRRLRLLGALRDRA